MGETEIVLEEEKRKNPIGVLFRAEWESLGDRKGKFITYMTFFFIAAGIALLNPLVVGFL